MANPQKENGYTAIAHEILEQICKLPLNGTQFRIIMVVWRYTYGFSRKEHDLSLNFILNALGLKKSQEKQVRRELKTLIDQGLIIETEKPQKNSSRKLKFNKNYEEWTNKTSGLIRPVDKLDQRERTKKTTQTLVGLDHQDNNNITNIKEKYSIEVKNLSKYLKSKLESKGVTVFPRDWHLKNYAVIKNLLITVTEDDLKKCIEWGFNDNYWQTRIDSFYSIKAILPKYQLSKNVIPMKPKYEGIKM